MRTNTQTLREDSVCKRAKLRNRCRVYTFICFLKALRLQKSSNKLGAEIGHPEKRIFEASQQKQPNLIISTRGLQGKQEIDSRNLQILFGSVSRSSF